jgi:fucose permease
MNRVSRPQAIETRARAGFLVSGFLTALLPALLPAWGFDVSTDYGFVGRHFLAMVGGMVFCGLVIPRWFPGIGARTLLVTGCTASSLALVGLAVLPDRPLWRLAGIFVLGIAAGSLHSGLFRAIVRAWEKAPAMALTLGGVFFGSGSILAVLLVSRTFFDWPVEWILIGLAVVPGMFAIMYSRHAYPAPAFASHPKVVKQFQSGAAVLFSFLLFFQFGNEWSVAGWLPLYLVHRFGMSPAVALEYLALHFAALTVGRLLIHYLLPRINNWRLLATSAGTSLFACTVLAATQSRFGAIVSVMLLGLSFAAIYPITAEWIGRRFHYYHPGFFNGIFSIGLVGGMLAPWMIGELADWTGLWVIMTLPAIGTCMVVLFLCLIWMNAKVTGE